MPEFARIAEAVDPLEVLKAPMEHGLVPRTAMRPDWCSDGMARDEENAGAAEVSAQQIQIESELFDRFLVGLAEFAGGLGRPVARAVTDREIDLAVRGQVLQRHVIGSMLRAQFPGMDPSPLVDGLITPELSETQQKRKKRIECLIEAGFKTTASAEELGRRGARKVARELARKAANLIIEDEGWPDHIRSVEGRRKYRAELGDTVRSAVLSRWPAEFIEPHFRAMNLLEIWGRAFRRAYDEFFVWSEATGIAEPLMQIVMPEPSSRRAA